MNEEERRIILFQKLFILIGGMLMGVLLVGMVSASPYQLNLSTGELIDLGIGNDSATIIIYIYNYTTNHTNYTVQNITWVNITNVTNQTLFEVTNLTCVNCTQNYTNATYELEPRKYYLSNTSGTFYNVTQTEDKFVTKAVFEAGINNANSQINTLNSNLNIVNSNLNVTNSSVTEIKDKEKSKVTALWIVLIIVALISIVALWRAANQGGGE